MRNITALMQAYLKIICKTKKRTYTYTYRYLKRFYQSYINIVKFALISQGGRIIKLRIFLQYNKELIYRLKKLFVIVCHYEKHQILDL